MQSVADEGGMHMGELLFVNGRIFAGLGAPECEEVAIRDGLVTSLGASDDLRERVAQSTPVIDLGGRRVVPGLIDSHIHAIRAGATWRERVDWSGVSDLATALGLVRAAAADRPGQWVAVVGGWHPGQFAERRAPTPAELTDAAPTPPVYVQLLYEAALLNAEGLKAAGIERGTPDPPNSVFARDRAGAPTGHAHGRGAFAHVLALMAEPDLEERVAGTRDFLGRLSSLGLTGVVDPGGRIDLPDKVWGRIRFIQDIRPPGMFHGRVVRPPSPGARLASLSAVDLPTDVRLVRDGSFLGVVAGTERAAVRAAEALRDAATWSERETLPDEDNVAAYLRSAPHEVLAVADSGRHPERDTLRRTYSRPFLAHASMAPSCGLARWQGDRLEVWSHTQGVYPLRAAIALALGVDADQITVNHVESAGCYGHNGSDDAAFDAVLLARAVPDAMVRVLWTRADELSWAPFGSAMLVDLAATVDDTGDVSSWRCDVFSLGHTSRPGYGGGIPGFVAGLHLGAPLRSGPAVDPALPRGGATRNAIPGYAFPAVDVRGHRVLDESLRTSSLRSLGAHMNVFAIESLVDELALRGGVDPLAYRLRQLSDPRGRAVLERVAALAGWGDGIPQEGRGRGLGYARYKGNGGYCAVVAEVDAIDDIALRRLTLVVDVGRVVNLDGVVNQVEGGAVQAASWTLKERVRFDRIRVTSTDWEAYPILRFSEVPETEVSVVDRPDEPSVGAGEVAHGPVSAAIANAVADAVGVRVRDMPITRAAVVTAIEQDSLDSATHWPQ